MLELNKIYCGDATKLLNDIDDNTIDLTVTSPPYDGMRTYEGSLEWDETIWKDIIKQLHRVTKPGGIVCWIVNDTVVNGSKTLTSFKQAIYAKDGCGFNHHDTMLYAKTGVVHPDSTRYNKMFEYIFIWSKGKPKTINLLNDRYNKYAGEKIRGKCRQKDGTIKTYGSKIEKKIKKFGTRGNIWQYDVGYHKSTKDKIAYKHPAIFPEKLAHDLILSYSNKNDIVIDPMCGSGTTLKKAHYLGRKYIGIDKVPKYVDIANKRLFGIF